MILLLVLFNICHWAADFTHLSTNWMLDAKKRGSPLLPILAHAAIHAVLFFIVSLFFTSLKIALFVLTIQLLVHFLIDWAKGQCNNLNPNLANPQNKYYWWLLGFDQFCHQMVIIFLTVLVCGRLS